MSLSRAPFTKLAGLLLALFAFHVSAVPMAEDSLVGIWGSERVLGPQVRGELTLVRAGNSWHARIAGFDVPARVESRKVSVVLPGDRGELRATLAENGQSITGLLTKLDVGGDGRQWV